uniref:Rx N-terminal domain-containing protein n=1 Tax=Cannabis sativa TaxID=3483 RepID=A0A803P8X1_CANSA
MAVELVAGALLSASLQILFERLASQDIPQLFQGKKPILKLLDKLNTRMLSANKLLNDAEDKQLRDDNVKQWLFKLQDVIYQADDLVDMIDYEALRSNQSSSRATKMGRLINLRYLDIDGVPLKDSEFPQQLSTMKHLSFLSNVVLSSDRNSSGGFKMKKVGELENLRCISGLENIKDGIEASEANLKDKKYLSELTLKWDDDDNDGYVAANSQKEKEKEKDILDALRPHTNLEHLRIVGYRGSSFSEWIGDSAFAKLVSVSFINCDDNYKAALPLFSCLESLTIADMMEWKDWSFSSEEAMQQVVKDNTILC